MHDVLTREAIIARVQDYCADLLASDREWDYADAKLVAELLKEDADPIGLFRLLDEKTGDWRIGYKTKDGREWHPILRQMRNRMKGEGGLFDYM